MASILQRLAGLMSARVPRARPMTEMGVNGTALYGGYIQSIDRSRKWQGVQRYTTATDIAVNVSIVAASIQYFLNLIAHPKWTVTPKDEKDAEAVKLAEFMQEVIESTATPWARIVRRAGLYRFHGFSIQEWTAMKREDGQIIYRDIEPRPQFSIERWEVDDDGSVTGVWQRSPQTGELLGIPRSKIVYLVDDTLSDSPEGVGIYRQLLEPYERLQQYLKLEARGFERDLRGIPIGRAPITLLNQAVKAGTLTKPEVDRLIGGLSDMVKLQVKQSDTGLVLDSQPYEYPAADGPKIAGMPQWNIELMTGSGAGLSELGAAVDRIQREMARIMGTEHLMMGDQGGNRALAADKSRNLYLIGNSVLSNIAEAFNKDLIDPIWTLNNFPEDKKPRFTVEDVSFKDVTQVTAALRDMATAGAVLAPDDPAINDIRGLLGIAPMEPMTPERIAMMQALSGGLPAGGGQESPAEGEGGPPKGTQPAPKEVGKGLVVDQDEFLRWMEEAEAAGLEPDEMLDNLRENFANGAASPQTFAKCRQWLIDRYVQ